MNLDKLNNCFVSLYTSFRTETKCTCSEPEYTDIKIWDSNRKDQFEENINQTMLIKILDDISRIPQESQDQVKDINSVINSIGSLFMEAAEKSFGLSKPRSKSQNCMVHNNSRLNSNLPSWFKSDFVKARKQFHRAKFNYKLRKTEINETNLKRCSKNYKCISSKYSKLKKKKK